MWGAIIGAGLNMMARRRNERKAAQEDFGRSVEMERERGKQQRQTSLFEASLQDYYRQRDRHRAARSLNEFRKFARMQEVQPGYQQDFQMDPVPPMPEVT